MFSISLGTSGDYTFAASGEQHHSAKFPTVSISLCCLAMRAACNPPSLPPAPEDASRSGPPVPPPNPHTYALSPRGPEERAAAPPPPAAEDLLIPSSGCGRAGGSCSVAAVSSGVRSRAHFTCGWARISIRLASPPVPAPFSPRRLHVAFPDARASALMVGGTMPRASINEGTLILLDDIDLLQLPPPPHAPPEKG